VATDKEHVRGLLNAIVYDIEFVESLSPGMAARCVEVIRTPGGYFSLHSPGEYLAALDIGLAEGMLPSVDTYRRRFTDEEIVEFLRLVQTELRKPQPGSKGRDIRSRLSTE
jgi:hypothetical protein